MTADIPSATGTVPSFAPTSAPPPLDPKEFIASRAKDTAPLSAKLLFPGTQLTMGSTVYKKGETSDTKNCAAADAVQTSLGKILKANGCTQFMRVSYTKDGVSVTVGVAVFDTEAAAQKAKSQVNTKKDIVKSLPGGAVKAFCNSAICRTTSNSYGRYAYFTISGFAAWEERHGEGHRGLQHRRQPGRVHLPPDPPTGRGPGLQRGGRVTRRARARRALPARSAQVCSQEPLRAGSGYGTTGSRDWPGSPAPRPAMRLPDALKTQVR